MLGIFNRFKRGKKLIFGLGNPGRDHEGSLHNVGFMAVDIIAAKYGLSVEKSKRDARIAEVRELNALLIKPQTFMNLSGRCVLDYAAYYKAQPQDIIVIYDDIDLKLGNVRIRGAGGPGTHNGMRDIVKSISTEDFPRVRIGVGPKPEKWKLADYVLSAPKGEAEIILKESCERAAEAVISIIKDGVDIAQSKYNKRKPT